MSIFITNSSVATKNLGKKLAETLICQTNKICRTADFIRANTAFVVALYGDLGSGKTTFVQGLAEGLRVKERVVSPTFVLVKKFKVQSSKFKVAVKNSKLKEKEFQFLFHIDAYRLNNPKEILELGWQEIIANPKNIIIVEWPEKIKEFLPKNCLKIKFKFISLKQRKISFDKPLFKC